MGAVNSRGYREIRAASVVDWMPFINDGSRRNTSTGCPNIRSGGSIGTNIEMDHKKVVKKV
jgi:hypothetical protein